MSEPKIKSKNISKDTALKLASTFGFISKEEESKLRVKKGRPVKNYECPCGERNPDKFFNTYKSICKECKSKKTLKSYTPKKIKKDTESVEKKDESDSEDDYKFDDSLEIKSKKADEFVENFNDNFVKDIREIYPNLREIIKNDTLNTPDKINNMFNDVILPYLREKIKDTFLML